jgi:hypothetical protein
VTALFAAVLLAVAFAPDTAGADGRSDLGPAVIAVAIPAGQNSAMQEALNRLRGEALSVGFEVRFIHADTPNTPAAQLETLAPGPRTAAVVVFADPADAASVGSVPRHLDVWFLDRSSGKTSVAHLHVADEELDRADVVTAVRAVDFIRARMFDTLAYRLATAKSLPSPSPSPSARTPAIRDRTYLAGGLAVLGTTSGFGPSLQPYLEAGFQLRFWVRATASAFGFGTRPSLQAQEGTLRVDQSFIGLGLTFTRWQWWRFLPHAEIGGGAYHVAAEGTANSGFQGQRITAWSLGGRASVGAAVTLARHWFFDVTAGSLWLRQEPRLYSLSTFVASTGRPSWIGTALVGARF